MAFTSASVGNEESPVSCQYVVRRFANLIQMNSCTTKLYVVSASNCALSKIYFLLVYRQYLYLLAVVWSYSIMMWSKTSLLHLDPPHTAQLTIGFTMLFMLLINQILLHTSDTRVLLLFCLFYSANCFTVTAGWHILLCHVRVWATHRSASIRELDYHSRAKPGCDQRREAVSQRG